MRIFRIVSIVLLIACCVTIFCFSSQNSESSSELSSGITHSVISAIYPHFSELSADKQDKIINIATLIIRKSAHFGIFMILGVFSLMSIISYNRPQKTKKLLISSVFCLLYAISDEVHQLFVSGRSGEIRDVCIDFIGAILGIVLCSILFNRIKFLKVFVGGKDA